jgi:hypothetical protein
MADPDFKVSDFAKHMKVLYDCMANVDDKKPTFDRKAARDAIKAMGDMLGTGEADDSDPVLDPQERKLKGGSPTQERATGNDSRHVIHNIDSIFGGGKHQSEGASAIAPSLDDIFKSQPLGEG